ncbi:MAG: NYN domain-containing protein [Thermodesulfobacteriota bacterium]
MGMHLLIDGYNLLHTDRILAHLNPTELQHERDRLIDQLSAYRSLKPMGITVVFDGWQGGWPTEKREKKKGIELVFSRLGEKADEVIKRLVKEKGAAVTVISSDREVSRYAEKMAVAAVSSAQFKEKMERTLQKGRQTLEDEGESRGEKRKGPSRRLSKREKRVRSALKKL